jgi:alpha-1,3-rhamnosyl/mannosyltransferase
LNSALSKIGADVFHATATTGIPFQGCRCPAIVTVHDLFPLYGELPFSLSRRIKFRTLFSWCAKNADAFVCNSEDTRGALLRHYPRIPRERAFVTLLGGSEEARLEIPRSGVPEGGGILLCLGGVERRKGQLFLLDVYKRLADSGKELPELVFAGEDRGDGAELARRIGEYGLSGKVEWLGHVDGDARRALFADTLLFLMPSSHEGFGIPLVDMMELGIPFIASDIPVFREVAGPAGCLRSLGDADAWSAALSDLLDSEEEMMRLVAAGRKRVEDFSWEKCAGETLDVYRRIQEFHEKSRCDT